MIAIRHVHGLRTLESHPEKSRAQITLATTIPESACHKTKERTTKPAKGVTT